LLFFQPVVEAQPFDHVTLVLDDDRRAYTQAGTLRWRQFLRCATMGSYDDR
jgi:hypothetical protein